MNGDSWEIFCEATKKSNKNELVHYKELDMTWREFEEAL